MSDTPTIDATENLSNPQVVAPPTQAGEQQGSTPAPADTAASETVKPEGAEPDKQSRRASREFANLRRENRDLYRRLGGLEAMLEGGRSPQPQQPNDGEPVPHQRQTRPPSPMDEAQANLNRSILEEIEDAGEEFEAVVEKITAQSFPLTVAMRDYLATSDNPAVAAKALADNPKEALRISLLSDRAADRAMERLEKRGGATKPAPRTTNAPPPVPTVAGRSTASFDPAKADMDEYSVYWKARKAKA